MILFLWLFMFNIAFAFDNDVGPVAKAAQQSLESGNINYVLIWTRPPFDDSLKSAFKEALTARKINPTAADSEFKHIAVHLHRKTEKIPPNTQLTPAIAAAIKAIDDGTTDPVKKFVADLANDELEKKMKKVLAAKNHNVNDIAEGREYVKDYVAFVRHVELLRDAIQSVGK